MLAWLIREICQRGVGVEVVAKVLLVPLRVVLHLLLRRLQLARATVQATVAVVATAIVAQNGVSVRRSRKNIGRLRNVASRADVLNVPRSKIQEMNHIESLNQNQNSDFNDQSNVQVEVLMKVCSTEKLLVRTKMLEIRPE